MFLFLCVLYVGSIKICFCVCKLLCVVACVLYAITNVYVSVVYECVASYMFLTLIVIESPYNAQASRAHTIVVTYMFENFSWPN
jgi:hypothetical protein